MFAKFFYRMAPTHNRAEVARLIRAFEREAAKFHHIQFHLLYATQQSLSFNRKFRRPNHAIMLWQYYGNITGDASIDSLVADFKTSNLRWGLRGAEFSLFGIIEGKATTRFIRMASRAGAIFDERESLAIKNYLLDEIASQEKGRGKPVVTANGNPVAVWLNYLLYYISMTHPGKDRLQRIEPDLFTLSLLALERLDQDGVTKVDTSQSPIDQTKFQVALSFPGEKRLVVSKIAERLTRQLGKDSVFYDYDYQSQLARPNLDLLLQSIYRHQSKLVVVFLCADYERKRWCGLEWRAVRDIIMAKEDSKVFFVRFDDSSIPGVFALDGYVDARTNSGDKIADMIIDRLGTL